MSAVVHGHARAHADPDLGEIQSDPVSPAHAIVGNPDHLTDIHAARAGVVLDKLSEGVVHQAGNPCGAHAVAGQGIRDIVLPAAGIHFEHGRELDPLVARRTEADHAFSESQKIEMRCVSGLKGKSHCCLQDSVRVRGTGQCRRALPDTPEQVLAFVCAVRSDISATVRAAAARTSGGYTAGAPPQNSNRRRSVTHQSRDRAGDCRSHG